MNKKIILKIIVYLLMLLGLASIVTGFMLFIIYSNVLYCLIIANAGLIAIILGILDIKKPLEEILNA